MMPRWVRWSRWLFAAYWKRDERGRWRCSVASTETLALWSIWVALGTGLVWLCAGLKRLRDG